MVARSTEVEEIYQRMAVIRREPHTNVSESVAGAEAVVDWGRYAWMYPWMALGAAAVTGYLVYTGSRQKVTAAADSPAEETAARQPAVEAGVKDEQRAGAIQSLLFAVGGVVLPVAISAGQNYVLRWLEQQYPSRPVNQNVAPQPTEVAGGRSNRAGR